MAQTALLVLIIAAFMRRSRIARRHEVSPSDCRELGGTMALNTTNRSRRTLSLISASLLGLLMAAPAALARGPSPYLPLDIAPAMERKIERVLVLAGKPVMRRPIAAAIVLDALPTACERDRALCEEVRRYLDRYMNRFGVAHARIEGTITSGDSDATLPNSHGEAVDSAWRVAASGYFQPHDYVILNAGGIAYDGRATPTGSFLSVGFDFAQLDIGFRDHWLGPMRDSSATISTEAPTMPSITLSNYAPISRLGLNYEIFAAEMSRQSNIRFQGGTTEGKPRLAGLQLGIEPVIGYALAVNRVTQYGGGARGGRSFSDFFDALTTSSNEADEPDGSSDVNRIASVTSNILFPGPVPFGVRIEYAGEDNTYEGKLRLGQTILSLGVDFPLLWRDFDATYEISEFQNGWYIHHIFPDGPRNEGNVLGHWFADNRLQNDAIGGRSHMLRFGWELPNGDYAQARYRMLDLDPRWAFGNNERPYSTMQMLGVEYATQWRGFGINAQLEVGEDIFGESFARIGAAFDFAPTSRTARYDDSGDEFRSTGTELFFDAGVQYSSAREIVWLESGRSQNTGYETSYHFGAGARRPIASRHDLGVRIEVDEVAERTLVSLRALDYRFRVNKKLAASAFFGVGRYDLTLDAHGYYMGGGLQYRDLLPGWDVGLDYRYYDKLDRDKGLPNDPESNPGLPRRYVDIHGLSLYLTKRW